MKTTDAIPSDLIICNSGYVTKVNGPTDEELEIAELKETWYRTTRAWPDLIILNSGYVTRTTGPPTT